MPDTTQPNTRTDHRPMEMADRLDRLRRQVGRIVVGQEHVLEQLLMALAARGHCLLIGVPGLAKTLMAKVLADCLAMKFARVQFTPDLMPSDITGTNILEEDADSGAKRFRFLAGPVFANILLADEINRTPPKTQASLLEAMQERSVTFGGETRPLPDPFFVMATQNPLEQEGTYPLPEAQLDRFMFSVVVGYPTHQQENRIVAATTRSGAPKVEKVLGIDEVRAIQQTVRTAGASPQVVRYAVALARATRPTDPTAPPFVRSYVDTGAGPRAGQYLVLGAKGRAVLAGRVAATIEDVRAVAVPVLRHRLFTNFTALSENVTSDDLIQQLLNTIGTVTSVAPIVQPAHGEQADTGAPGSVSLSSDMPAVSMVRRMKDITQQIRDQVHQRIIGQHDVVDLVLAAMLAGGHCLLVGVPGLAKTLLVQTLADVLKLKFKRVQFTPDLMPSDITGTDVLHIDEATGTREFQFLPGPVFTNLLLADEINRTPPKTQAALLEAMQELAVTAGGTTYALKPPFLVLATQNPIEHEGTYPLPEAQLDRFMFNVFLDYPTADEEPQIVEHTTRAVAESLRPVIGAEDIMRLQRVVRQVPVSRHVLTYVTTLVRASRPQTADCPEAIKKYVHCGAGPRASQYLVLGAKAWAVMHGRLNVSIADVKAVSVPVLRHRIFTNFSADAEGVSAMELVKTLLDSVPEPSVKEQTSEADATETSPPAGADEALVVQCTACGMTLRVSHDAAGHTAKCRNCGQVFAV